MQLRAATPTDVQAMFELDLLCFEEPFRFDLKTMRRFALLPRAIALVVDLDATLNGFVIVHLRRGFGDVVTLDVHPSSRRKGIARALLDAAEGQAREAGARWMELHAFVGNAAAIRFYERAGYSSEMTVRSYYGSGLDALLYRKALA